MQTFPGQVSVEYYDAALPEVQTQFSEVIGEAQGRHWPYPLVMIGDEVAMAGDVNVYRISRLVSEQVMA
jgi:disulfide oxidoreductase YuzD